MPKLWATGAKTDQLGLANLQVFRGFSRELMVGVSARVALITQPSIRSVQEVLPQPSGVVDEQVEGPARHQPGAQKRLVR